MKHIAAIVHGNNFMIILPHANLYDLEVFLRGGYEPDPNTYDQRKIYDFDTKFPRLSESLVLQHALVEEAHQLASALKWLHEDLKIFGSSNRYLAHMDLKPANVLLVADARSPAGKTMLSDFGVSSFDKATNERAPDTPSIRDVGHRLTSRGFQYRIWRGHGPYQPPEVDLENVDRRKCDVWSFGCVLCEVLAFAIGKTEAVTNLRTKRYVRGDDFFYRISGTDDPSTELKSEIVDWWRSLECSSASWIKEYIQILQRALRVKPSDRPDIRDIVDGLDELAPSILSQMNGNLATESNGPSRRPQTKRGPSQEGQSIMISREASPPHFATIDLRDTAPEYLNRHRSLSEHLSPDHALYRESPPLSKNEEDSSQGLSSTEDLGNNAGLAHRTSSTLNMSKQCSSSPPDESPPKGHMLTFEERAKISISISKKDKVRAIAITASPLRVAVLFKHSVLLFSTIDDEERRRHIDLSLKVDWKRVRLASQCFAVYGLRPTNEKQVNYFPHLLWSSDYLGAFKSSQATD